MQFLEYESYKRSLCKYVKWYWIRFLNIQYGGVQKGASAIRFSEVVEVRRIFFELPQHL